jgi:polysaccharide export outer membrane protein
MLKQMKIISKYHLILTILISITLTSCSKKLLYLGDLQLPNDTLKTNYQPYKLKPYDYLYITIKTTDQNVNQLFSEFMQQQNISNNLNNKSNYYLTGYMVNDSGYVFLPIFGSFYAKGKTVEQFQTELQQAINKILTDAVVKVKLISYEVYFIGEVNTKVTFYKDKVNILEALAEIGGAPYSADKKDVIVLRKTDSAYVAIPIDLTSKNILENKTFYLQPEDIVYIKPRKSRIMQIQIQDYFIFVSLVSSVLSLSSFIITLLITRR